MYPFNAKDASGNECYPKDSNGDEYYIWNVWTHVPATHNGDAYYAKNHLGEEMLNELEICKRRRGKPFYPTDKNGEEKVYGDYIYNKDGSFKYPLNPDGHPLYAKKENGDEYYPPNGELAYDQYGSTQYSGTRDGEVIFPLDAERNESYLKDDTNGDSHMIYMGDDLLDRYDKTRNGEEIYPIQMTNQTTRHYKEVLLNEKYAKTDLKEAKYPLDEYGNEYTLEIPIQIAGNEKDYFPRGYPIINDNWVSVLEVDGKEFISDQLLAEV
ncbi:uncharacterized protein TNIN_267991 [Trichonephila inaurata madagascariensis]|uniref:Uncharacterized protein n=1 Tax=Trichonephila inaurata madagascariensis TaxID=2747483 RepID=A0A8X7C7X6_9ARAC|nr:uncharacterized protein TNIN_267991 [Trichonephila inaurata madagascariensis]